jgi:undecaprenyl-diphosphatase
MEYIDEIVLGLVQGLTEFLPVSSKGHLVLTQKFLGYEVHDLALDLVLHLGTVAVIITYYFPLFKRLFLDTLRALVQRKSNPSIRIVTLIGIGVVPVGVIGLLFKQDFERLFQSVEYTAYGFIFVGFVLWSTRRAKSTTIKTNFDDTQDMFHDFEHITWKHALIVGCAQIFALVPGVSRSGMTISAGLLSGLSGRAASSFSFLISVPTILGAAILKLKDIENITEHLPEYGVGFASALVFGWMGLIVTLKMVKKRRLEYFSIYLWILAALLLYNIHK